MTGDPSVPDAEKNVARRPFRFRLAHLIYLVTLLGVSLGAFGAVGIVPGVAAALFWIVVYFGRKPHVGVMNAIGLFAVSCCCGGLLLPAVRSSPAAARRMQCSNNMKQIVLALHNYYDQYQQFPPAYVADAQGKPMHSWRVLILPYIEEQTRYDKYRFDEPWNGPNNRQLLEPMPALFRCPSQANSPCTDYLAVVGPDTAWPGAVGRKKSDFADGTAETIMVVESGEPAVPWMEPRDLTLEEAIKYLSGEEGFQRHDAHWFGGYFDERYSGRTVALADGSVQFIGGIWPATTWSQILKIDDGPGSFFSHDLTYGRESQPRPLIGNYIRVALWVIVALWPVPFAVAGWRRRRSDRSGKM